MYFTSNEKQPNDIVSRSSGKRCANSIHFRKNFTICFTSTWPWIRRNMRPAWNFGVIVGMISIEINPFDFGCSADPNVTEPDMKAWSGRRNMPQSNVGVRRAVFLLLITGSMFSCCMHISCDGTHRELHQYHTEPSTLDIWSASNKIICECEPNFPLSLSFSGFCVWLFLTKAASIYSVYLTRFHCMKRSLIDVYWRFSVRIGVAKEKIRCKRAHRPTDRF